MQRIRNDSGGGGSGGGGSVRLGRFKSAPATWLETLLEEDDDDPLIKQNQNLTELLISGGDASTKGGINLPLGSSSSSLVEPSMGCLFEPGNRFQRQNSSPADYFSSFEIPSSSYQYLSKSVDVSNSANSRLQLLPKGEHSGQGSAGVSGSMDMEMEKLLEDSVPCRVRAKRGCATHPRSIAERVRRTRISDRIRKLQELVPKMDKQTNTAEMLDEAVEYVKFLQKQIQELKEHQQKCKCTAKE